MDTQTNRDRDMKQITISLPNSVIDYVGSRMPNLLDYINADTGKIEEGSNAYRFGMREGTELESLVNMFPISNGKRQKFNVPELWALVIRDRLEFAWEIASDNAADGDKQAARMALYCRSSISFIDGQLS